MGKIDLKADKKVTEEVKTPINNSTEAEKLANTEPTETPSQSEELINNASDDSEDTQETNEKTDKTEEQDAEKTGMVVVTYIGSGVWKDECGALWANHKPESAGSIVSERQYPTSEYDKREDIKFMVGYGAMKATFVK